MSTQQAQISKSRFWLLVVLLLLLVFFAGLLFMRSKSIEKFKIELGTIKNEEKLYIIDTCRSKLYTIENNGRLYTLTKDSVYLNKYKNELLELKKTIVLLHQTFLEKGNSKDTLTGLIDEKFIFDKQLFDLNNFTDSLLKISFQLKDLGKLSKSDSVLIKPHFSFKTQVIIDTIYENKLVINNPPPPKKGFFKRIVNAFSNKKEPITSTDSSQTKKIVRKQISIDTSVVAVKYNKQQLQKIEKYYLAYIRSRNKLNEQKIKLLLLNDKIFREFKFTLTDLKTKLYNKSNVQNNKLKDDLSNYIDQYGFNATGLIAIIALLSFIVVVNLRRLYLDERDLLEYSQKVHEYANHNKEFLANMSHELRTPLNSIIGFSEQLEHAELHQKEADYVSAIHSSSSMLLGIVNDILDFSRLELEKVALMKQPFFVHKLMTDLVETIDIQAKKKGLALLTEFNFDENVCLSSDTFRIKQITLNLLSNAIKYTREGAVTLKTDLEPIVESSKINLIIKVIDTGIGIDKNHLESIFEKFAQVNSTDYTEWQTGTGLGLSITKRIVGLFGGDIHVQSQKDVGSTFTVKIPLEYCNFDNINKIETDKIDFTKEIFKNTKILLVDDNLMNIKLAAVLLKKWNVNYDVAYNGKEAFELFKNNIYSLILTDIQMPIFSGVELTHAVRTFPDAYKSNIPIIGVTANVLEYDIKEYLDAGMNDILLKPYSEQEYLNKIIKQIQ